MNHERTERTERTDPFRTTASPASARYEASRAERRDVDREHGEPLAAGNRFVPSRRATPPEAKPLSEWTTRPRILVTNDDGIESPGLLKLRQALETGDAASAQKLLPTTLGAVDHAAKLGAIHVKAASRTKSRLTRALNKLGA